MNRKVWFALAVVMVFCLAALTLTGCEGSTGPVGKNGIDGTDGVDGQDGVDGKNGQDGVSLIWKGSYTSIEALLNADPDFPRIGWVYRNTTDGIVYLYNGVTWDIVVTPGVNGENGQDGRDGNSVYIKGSVANADALPMTGNDPENGLQPAYITENDGHLHVWNGSAWVNVGEIKGPKGDTGTAGTAGATGPVGPTGAAGPAGQASYSLIFYGNSDRAQLEGYTRNQVRFGTDHWETFEILSAAAAVAGEESYVPVEVVPQPTRFGYTFEGWYLDSKCTTEWDRKVTGDLKLYAKWDFIKMIKVNGGSYLQGNNAADAPADQKPRTERTVSGFYMGQFEITQDQYERVTGNNPSANKASGRHPVTNITWLQMFQFCNALSDYEGLQRVYTTIGTGNSGEGTVADWSRNGYRLPTECEWEYAAKGGHLAQTGLSGDPYYIYAGSNNVNDVAWDLNNSGGNTHPAGQKLPNQLGLYDMSGNVRESCWDWYGADYYSADSTISIDRRGPATGINRVCRGGNATSTALNWTEITSRSEYSNANPLVGLRVVRRAD